MSACDELRPRAAGVASLPESDPERREYLAHAQGCPGCLQALREGEKLMALLGEVEQPAPSAQALQRASAAVLAELRPARPGLRDGALRAGAALAGFLVPLLIARHRDTEAWGAALATVVGATALAATAGALRAGALVALAASAGFALAAGGVPGFAPGGDGMAAALGAECLVVELLSAALPLAAAAWMFRRDPRPGSLAQAAAAGALAGQAALHLGCSAHASAPHLWVFHVGGVALAALVGWIVESRLVAAERGYKP
jgi:hypothetical protein